MISNEKVALVTGGSHGIGNGIAKKLAESGIFSILVGRDESALKLSIEDIRNKGGDCTYFIADFDDQKSIPNLLADLEKQNLEPNILINGLGGGFQSRTTDDIQTYHRIMSLNFYVAVSLSNTLVEHMYQKGWGRIIFIGTLATNQLSAEAPYVCAKSALMTYMKLFSKQVAEKNEKVVVAGISPGAISVPGKFLHKIESENSAELKNFLRVNRISAGRLGKISEVASVVSFLCSDEANYLHGANIQIDGGAST